MFSKNELNQNSIAVGCSLFLLANTAAFLGIAEFFNFKNWIICYLSGALEVFLWMFLYFVWVHALGLPYPVPFIGMAVGFFTIVLIIIAIWFSFPKTWRNNQMFQIRARYMVCAHFFLIFMILEYCILMWVLYVIPINVQWILAIGLQIIR